MHLGYVHSFRAMATIMIVGGHVIASLSWAANPLTASVLRDVLDNGTVLFVFLAGFLFEYRMVDRSYFTYLRGRFTRLLLPYLVLAVPLVVWDVARGDAVEKFPQELNGTSALYQALWFLTKGSIVINYALWFVPMMTLFYLAMPLFSFIARHPRLYLVLVVLIPLSLFLHRVSELDTAWMALYFLAAYITGMWASHARERLEPVLLRVWPVLLLLVVGITVGLALFADHHGNYFGIAPFSQEHGPVDWLFAQKLLLCFGLLGLMLRLQPQVGPFLRYLADISLSIVLLHVYLLYAINLGERRLGFVPVGNVVTWVGMTALAVAFTALGTMCAQRVLGNRSKLLIGS
jgi:probable poly-beta-1,6-N-acetyl-D-glucosamine export protein